MAGQQDQAPVLTGEGVLTGEPVPRAFFDRDVLDVAPDLLGCVVEHAGPGGSVAIRLTEVEAYRGGGQDPASHAHRGLRPRNAVMFGPPGHMYVYFTYGMHWCANLVCGPPGVADAVLLRAGEVVAGFELARLRRAGVNRAGVTRAGITRGPKRDADLAQGPARLAQCLGLSRADNGKDVCDGGPLRVRRGTPPTAMLSGPRVGVAAAHDIPWRFWLDGEPSVSAYRPHKARRASDSVL